MLGWKLPHWRQRNARSTTEVSVALRDELVPLREALGWASGEPRAVLRLVINDATLDTCCAAYFAVHQLLHQSLPDSHPDWVDFVGEWEQGRIERAGSYERSLASVFYATVGLDRTGEARPPPEAVRLLAEVISRGLNAAQLAELPKDLIPARVARRLRADTDLYRAELSRARLVQLDLPVDNRPDAPRRRVDAMFLSSGQDVTVLKLLARPDAEHSTYGMGFDVLAVHAPHERHAYARHTITIPPERGGALAGLAEQLDELEGPKAPEGALRARGKPRFAGQSNDYSDPWYSDGYASTDGRATIVAPPFAGTRLSREQVWETVWERFNVGRRIHVTRSRTIFVRPYRMREEVSVDALLAAGGWQEAPPEDPSASFLTPVATSFHARRPSGDVVHLTRQDETRTVHVSLYPSELALVWIEEERRDVSLFDLAADQARLASSEELEGLAALSSLLPQLEPLVAKRWHVYGAYRIDRGRSAMLDESRSVLGLFHALASGTSPALHELPSSEALERRRVLRDGSGDLEHWFTATGGARLELSLEDSGRALAVDRDFQLFLLTCGQRYTVFEIHRQMAAIERRSRISRWQSLRPVGDVRGDVMFFTNSLWYTRVSDDPDFDARYRAWHELHAMNETVDAMRDQTNELDQFRKERFESMVGLMVFVFLPITIVCGFFSGAQFNEMDVRVGLPWTTGGWVIFLLYTAFFTVLVFGTYVLGRLISWRGR